MFSRIHNKLGTAGLVIAMVALMLTLAGTFFLSQKKEVKKIAKEASGGVRTAWEKVQAGTEQAERGREFP